MNTPSGILGRWTRRLGTWATLVGTCACSGASSSANQRCTAAPNTQAAAEGTPTECARADEAIRRAQAHLGQGHLVLAAQELELLEKDLKVEAPADLWRSLEVKARAGLNSTNDPTSAEHLLWRGIVAHIQHAQGDRSVGRPPLGRLIEERLETRVYVSLRLAAVGACPDLQSDVRHFFAYRMLAVDRMRVDPSVLTGAAARKAAQGLQTDGAPEAAEVYVTPSMADEVVRFLSCEMDRKSGDFVVRWERSIQLPEYDFCEMRPDTAGVESPTYFRNCSPDLLAATGMDSPPRSRRTVEHRFAARGDEEWGRLLFLDSFGRGKALRGVPVFLESRDLYPQGLELPKFEDELRAFVAARSELRLVLREAALRRVLELGNEADDDYLVSIFAPEFLQEFGLHPSQISAVMRWHW